MGFYFKEVYDVVDKQKNDIKKIFKEFVESRIRGRRENVQIKKIFEETHLFFLPTLGENYGYSIVESLSNSIPVLISDNTPFRNLEKLGFGFDISLQNEKEFFSLIRNSTNKIYLVGSSQTARLNVTYIKNSLDKNQFNYEIFNLYV